MTESQPSNPAPTPPGDDHAPARETPRKWWQRLRDRLCGDKCRTAKTVTLPAGAKPLG